MQKRPLLRDRWIPQWLVTDFKWLNARSVPGRAGSSKKVLRTQAGKKNLRTQLGAHAAFGTMSLNIRNVCLVNFFNNGRCI